MLNPFVLIVFLSNHVPFPKSQNSARLTYLTFLKDPQSSIEATRDSDPYLEGRGTDRRLVTGIAGVVLRLIRLRLHVYLLSPPTSPRKNHQKAGNPYPEPLSRS